MYSPLSVCFCVWWNNPNWVKTATKRQRVLKFFLGIIYCFIDITNYMVWVKTALFVDKTGTNT